MGAVINSTRHAGAGCRRTYKRNKLFIGIHRFPFAIRLSRACVCVFYVGLQASSKLLPNYVYGSAQIELISTHELSLQLSSRAYHLDYWEFNIHTRAIYAFSYSGILIQVAKGC